MKLYKYTKKEFAIRMMQEGEFQINTLYNLRQCEHKEIGDENEGTKKSITNFPDGVLIKDKEEWNSKLGHLKGSNITYVKGNVKFEPDTKLIGIYDVPDLYVYCTSLIYDPDLKPRFSKSCESACVEICDAESFSKAILKELVARGLTYDYCLRDKCVYIGHDVDHTIQTPAYFLKDPDEYMHQKEYRLVFLPIIKNGDKIIQPIVKKENGIIIGFEPQKTDVKIVPTIIKCREAIKYCSME